VSYTKTNEDQSGHVAFWWDARLAAPLPILSIALTPIESFDFDD